MRRSLFFVMFALCLCSMPVWADKAPSPPPAPEEEGSCSVSSPLVGNGIAAVSVLALVGLSLRKKSKVS
jgi:hypothetical protein